MCAAVGVRGLKQPNPLLTGRSAHPAGRATCLCIVCWPAGAGAAVVTQVTAPFCESVDDARTTTHIQETSMKVVKDATADDPTFRAFLPEFEAGIRAFINGNPARWKQDASQREDVTIMGA